MDFSDILNRFIDSTAWRMETPKAYGAFHLIFTVVGFAAALFLAYKLRNVSERGHRAVCLTVGGYLMLSEVYKQLLYFYNINEGEYSWWIFPFQLCSVPMYLCMIAPFLKSKPLADAMYNFMVYFNLLGGFMAFIEPSGILHGHVTLTLHSCMWHMTLVFLGLYLCFSGRSGIRWQDYRASVYTFLCMSAVAFAINLIFWKPAEGDINMFFVGPKNSPLIVFKDIAETAGWYTSTLLYIPTVCLGAMLVFLLVRYIKKKKTS